MLRHSGLNVMRHLLSALPASPPKFSGFRRKEKPQPGSWGTGLGLPSSGLSKRQSAEAKAVPTSVRFRGDLSREAHRRAYAAALLQVRAFATSATSCRITTSFGSLALRNTLPLVMPADWRPTRRRKARRGSGKRAILEDLTKARPRAVAQLIRATRRRQRRFVFAFPQRAR